MLATQPSLHILSVNKSLLRFLHVKLIFWTWTTPYATNSVMAQTSSWLKFTVTTQNCYSLYSQNCIQAQAYLYFTACLFCAPETLNHNRQRLVLGPESLLIVYTSISYLDNTLDYYIKDILQIHQTNSPVIRNKLQT